MSTTTAVEKEAASVMGTNTEDGRPFGHLGALTAAQQECLCQMWDGLLAFLYDDQERVKTLGYESAFTDILLKRGDNTATNEGITTEPSTTAASSGTATPAEDPSAPKKRSGSLWGGLANGLTSIATAARSKVMDTGDEEDGVCSSKRPVTLEEMRQEFWNLIMHDHPDSLLLRFLRARKWEVVKALSAAVNTLQWRIREDVAGIIREGEFKLNTRPLKLGQSYIHATDRKDRPVCYINVRYHNKELQPFQDIRRFTIWTMETTRLMIHAPVETADIIFDLAEFTMTNMDYKFVKFIIQCFQAYYPESLGVYIVTNAPFFFRGIWNIINPWLDPVVAAKFRCSGKLTELQEFIPAENLPPRLSGTDPYEYYYPPPRTEDDLRLLDTNKRDIRQKEFTAISDRFLEATRQWVNEAKKKSDKAAYAFKARDPIAAEMNTAYFKLDPYIRSRTLYHRLGVLGEDGSCDWSKLLTKEQYEAKSAQESSDAVKTTKAAEEEGESDTSGTPVITQINIVEEVIVNEDDEQVIVTQVTEQLSEIVTSPTPATDPSSLNNDEKSSVPIS